MDINELESFNMADAVAFHEELNPKLWENEKLDPEVRDQLLLIAEDFVEYLGISNLKVRDVTLSGSNAAYSYTPHSDLDLHVLVDFNELPNNEVYQELFTAKKTLYNDAHDITVREVPVELYVQDTNNPVQSLGEYSIVHDKWIRIPKKRRANFDQTATKLKYEKLGELIELALKTKDPKRVNDTIALVKRYRKSGLDKAGEFGPENLAYKAVRKQGLVQALHDLKVQLHTEKLSIEESDDKQAAVLKIQKHLNKKYGANLDLDGKLGPLTLKSINKFMPKAKTGLADEPNKTTAVQGKKLKEAPRTFQPQTTPIQELISDYNYFTSFGTVHLEKQGKTPEAQKELLALVQRLQKDAKVFGSVVRDKKKMEANRDTILTHIYQMMTYAIPILKKNLPADDWEAKRSQINSVLTSYNNVRQINEASDYNQHENEIEGFVQSLNPDDVGVEQIGPYHVHFEGFTDECQQDAERRCNLPSDSPQHLANYDDVYKEVIRDFVRREGGKKPLKVGFAGYQDYPVVYAVFDNPEPYKNPDAWNPKIDEEQERHPYPYGYWIDITGEVVPVETYNGHGTVGRAIMQKHDRRTKKGTIGDSLNLFYSGAIRVVTYNYPDMEVEVCEPNIKAARSLTRLLRDIQPNTVYYENNCKMGVDPQSGSWQEASRWLMQQAVEPDYYGKIAQDKYGTKNELVKEASGYIPSAKEKNDPRFKTALTVDVKPDAIKKNAKAFGFKTSRAGIPPQARADGKIAEDLMREFKTFLGEQQEEMFPGYDEQHREKRLGNWLAKSWGVQNGKPQTFYHATTKDFDTFNTSGTGFASALGMAYEVERHGSFFAVDPKFAEGFIEDPNTGRVKEGGRILPVHLSIQSPIDLRDDALSRMLSDEETVDEFKANGIDLRSIYNHFYELERWELFDGPEGAEFIDNLQKLGFDGAIINEAIPNNSNAKSGQVWVAFSPNQVKSVYNRGSFSPDDARLTKESG
jgi:predicted nucleotidyltransferase